MKFIFIVIKNDTFQRLKSRGISKVKDVIKMVNKKYRTVVIDFPWDIGLTGGMLKDRKFYRCGKPTPYKVMSDKEIQDFPIDDFADKDCDIFVWTTHSKLPFAIDLVKLWGFKYHCLITWDKTNGIGLNGFQRRTEMAIYAYKGRMGIIKTKGHYIPTLITEKLTTHSVKPTLFYTILKGRTLEPRIDIFARKRHEGFEAWGDEVEKELQTSIPPTLKRVGIFEATL